MNFSAENAVTKDWDVAVVGAGPAGAFIAQRLAVSGLHVLLIEKQKFPRSKICGCCFSARAVAVLRTAGLAHLLDRTGAQPVRSFALICKEHRMQLSLPAGRAVSRAAFDAALVDAAVSAGVSFLPEYRAILSSVRSSSRKLLLHHGQRTREIRAKVVIGADGLAGSLRRGFHELSSRPQRNSYIGAGVIAVSAPSAFEPGTIYMAYGRHGYTGLVRIEENRLAIAAALAVDFVKNAGTLARAVGKVLQEAGVPHALNLQELHWQGTPALTRRTTRKSAHRFFALGDAAGYTEPFTGEGISWALSSAEALVPLVQRGVSQWSPLLEHEWASVHRRVVGRRQAVCRMIARALRHPVLIETIVRLAEKHWLSLAPLAGYLHLEAGTERRRLVPGA
ncbi:MAG: NAD(P)/FAD-dependent oxidoreductase [bacterium]